MARRCNLMLFLVRDIDDTVPLLTHQVLAAHGQVLVPGWSAVVAVDKGAPEKAQRGISGQPRA